MWFWNKAVRRTMGGTVFLDATTQGFSNDVFSNFGFVSVKAGVSVKF